MNVDFGEKGNKKLTFEAPWDFDSAVGNRDRCADGTGFHCANLVWDVNSEYQTVNPWLTVLAYEEWFRNVEQTSSRLFMKYNVDKVSIAVDDDYVKCLMTLFKNR